MTKREFGDLENAILLVLRTKKRATVNCVQEALGNNDKYTTVMTVMTRLAKKGILERKRSGLRYEYWLAAAQGKEQSVLKRMCSKLFNLNTAEVVSYLINESKDFSDEDLEEVEKVIAEARKRKENSVP